MFTKPSKLLMKLALISSTLSKLPYLHLAQTGYHSTFNTPQNNFIFNPTIRGRSFLYHLQTSSSYPLLESLPTNHKYSRRSTVTNMSSTNTINAEEARSHKKELRKKIRSHLKSMTHEEIQTQSQQVWERLYTLPAYKDAKSIGLFLSMPKNEINTEPVLRQAILQHNKQVYIPRVGLDFEKCDMDLMRVLDASTEETLFYEHWPRNKWGIPEPPTDRENEDVAGPGDIDVLIVPGLAFDSAGGRLGQGKGYYDRFISRVRTSDNGAEGEKTPLLVAVGMKPQFLIEESVPTLDHDFQMDVVITPDDTIIL